MKDSEQKETKLVNFIWRNQLVSVPEDKVQEFLDAKNETEREN